MSKVFPNKNLIGLCLILGSLSLGKHLNNLLKDEMDHSMVLFSLDIFIHKQLCRKMEIGGAIYKKVSLNKNLSSKLFIK